MKKLLALLLVVILAVAVFGCTQTSTPSTPTQAPQKTEAPTNTDDNGGGTDQPTDEPEEIAHVVLIEPLSGPYAGMGLSNQAGFKGCIAAWEEAGGFKKHPNRKLEIEYLDHEINSEVCLSLFERYAPTTDIFCIGISTMSIIACQPLAAKYEIPIMCVGITADRALTEPNDWTFRCSSGDIGNAKTHKQFFEFLIDWQGHPFETYALVCTSDDYGMGSSAVFAEKLQELGAKPIMDNEVLQNGQTTDVSGVVSKIKAANPEVIIAACSTTEAALLMKTLKQFKVEIPLMTTGGGFGDPTFFEAVGPGGTDGAVACQTYMYEAYRFSTQPEKYKEWITRTEELTDFGWSEQTVHGWMPCGVTLAVLDEAETLDGQSILAALRSIDLPRDSLFNWYSLYEGCKFEQANGCYNQNKYAICIYGQIQNDAYVPVFIPGFEIPKDENPLVWPVKPYKD